MSATDHPSSSAQATPQNRALPMGKPRKPTCIPFNKFAAIDFETADYGRDSACAVAVVVAQEGRIVKQFSSLIRLARRLWDLYPTRLSDGCGHFGIPLQHHDAGSDALACARLSGCTSACILWSVPLPSPQSQPPRVSVCRMGR